MSTMQSLRRFAAKLLGQWQWQAPPWIEWARRQITRAQQFFAADHRRIYALSAAVVVIGFAVVFYVNRPKPHYVAYDVTPPGLTEYNEKGISKIYPLKVSFNEPAAPLKQIEKRVTTGVEISPAIAGTWFWVNDKEIQFSPQSDWPVDGAFTVRFGKKDFLASGVLIERYKFDFNSQPFTAQISESQFYQDPRDPNLKKLVATVKFSHPVDAEQLESHVSLAVAKDAGHLGLTPDSRHFTVTYDKFRLAAFIHSASLAMPRDDTPMTLNIDKGVRAARGGNATADRLSTVVTIPGRTSLRFTEARMVVVDNAKYEPEQILLVNSSSPVA